MLYVVPHDAKAVGTDVVDADVIALNDEDVWLLSLGDSASQSSSQHRLS